MIKKLRNKQQYAPFKLLGCIGLCFYIATCADRSSLLAASLLFFVLVLRLAVKQQIRLRSLFSVLFLAMAMALLHSLTDGGPVLAAWCLGGYNLVVYEEGIRNGILSSLRIISSSGLLMLFFRSVKLGEFLAALKKLRLPGVFSEVMLLAIKFIFIFREELGNISKAQRARLGYKSIGHSLSSMGQAGGILLEQAFNKSEELAKALSSRGYTGGSPIK